MIVRRLDLALVFLVFFILINGAWISREGLLTEGAVNKLELGAVGSLVVWGSRRIRLDKVAIAFVVYTSIAIMSFAVGNAYSDPRITPWVLLAFIGYQPLILLNGLYVSPAEVARLTVLSSVPGIILGYRQTLFGLTSEELTSLSLKQATYIVGDFFRAPGTFGSGQEFAAWTAILTILCLTMTIDDSRSSAERRTFWSVLALSAVLELLILQRTGVILASTGCAYVGLSTANWRVGRVTLRLSQLVMFIAAITGAALLFAHARATEAISRLVHGSSTSTIGGRVSTVWAEAAERIWKWPMLGGGPGSSAASSFVYSDHLSVEPLAPDNMALHVATQVGLLGLGAYLVLGVVLWREARRLSRPNSLFVRATTLGMVMGGVGASILGLANAVGCLGLMIGVARGSLGQMAPICPRAITGPRDPTRAPRLHNSVPSITHLSLDLA